MPRGVSIIIPTYNSASRLEPTIQHIAAQQLPTTLAWELIVVDNNSTDNTADVAKLLFEKYQIGVKSRIVFEPRQGLSFARECGMKNARYTYSIFCDDDNWLSEDYARRVFEQMETNNLMAALGGYGEPVCEISPPSWFKDLSSYYAVGAQASSEGKMENGYLYGAGMSIRNEAYYKIKEAGFNFILKGPEKNKVLAGEDSELILAFRLAGYEIWYDPNLKFKHFITKARLTTEYAFRLNKERRISIFLLAPYHHHLRGIPANGFYYSGWVLKNYTIGVLTSCLKLLFGNRLAKAHARQHLGSLKYMFFNIQDYFLIRKQIATWVNRL